MHGTMHFATYTHGCTWLHTVLNQKIWEYFCNLPAAYTLLNPSVNLLPKAQRSQLSSTAPPTNSTSTSSLILVCLLPDSGWNTKVSGGALDVECVYYIFCWLSSSLGAYILSVMF